MGVANFWQRGGSLSAWSTLLKRRQSLILLASILAVLLLFNGHKRGSFDGLATKLKYSQAIEENEIWNTTLGFQKIYALVLPDRQDRAIPLLAAANATGLDVEIVTAYRGPEIPPEEIPLTWNSFGNMNDGHLGCYGSHRRVWRKMLDENIESALILESDADWDMRIKSSMLGLAEGAKEIADFRFDPSPGAHGMGTHPRDLSLPHAPAPYGDNWDLLWIGHCGAHGDPDSRAYSYHDPSSGGREHAWIVDGAPISAWGDLLQTRLVFQLRTACCMPAYAISKRAAAKLDRKFAVGNDPVDLKLRAHCMGDQDLTCLATYPSIFSVSESKTNIGSDTLGTDVENVKPGWGLQISARMNSYLHLAEKGPEFWRREWEVPFPTRENITLEDGEMVDLAHSGPAGEMGMDFP